MACTCEERFQVNRLGEGDYVINGKNMFVRVSDQNILSHDYNWSGIRDVFEDNECVPANLSIV